MMKRFLGSMAIVTLTMVSCSDENEQLLNNNTSEVYFGEIVSVESRTSMDEGGKVIWSDGDAINLFKKTGYYQKYVVKAGGSTSAEFEYGNVNVTGSKLDQHYAVYPYAETNTISGTTVNMDLSMLSNQTYTEGTFAPNMSVMAAKSATTDLSFFNTLSIARVNLSIGGSVIDAVVKSVKLTSSDTSLTGTATIDMSKDKQPAIITGEGKEITLSVNDVALTKENTPFYIVLPAGTYADKTLTLTVNAEINGELQVCNIELPQAKFNRSEIKTINKCFNDDGEWNGSIGDEALENIGYRKISDTSYEVYNSNGMEWFYDELMAKKTFAGVTVKLIKDIDMTDVEWVSKTTDSYTNFAGIFDGNNKTITNFTAKTSSEGGYATMFDLFSGEVKDLTMDGVNATDDTRGGRASALVGYMSKGKLSNVNIKNATVTGYQKVAGLVSHPCDGEIVIENCSVENVTLKANTAGGGTLWQAGGLAGYASGYKSMSITGCSVENIVIENACTEVDCAGSPFYCHPFFGCIDYNGTTDVTVTLNNNTIGGTNTETDVCPGANNTYYGYGKHRGTGKLTINVDGEQVWPVIVATVNGIGYETLAKALENATSGAIVEVKAGTYTEVVNVRGGKNVTIQPANESDEVTIAGLDHQSNGNPSTIVVKNITLDNTLQTEGWFTGTAQNIKPCVGAWGGNFTFEGCKFIVEGTSGKETGVMTWWVTDKMSLTFNDCTFEGKDNHESARAMQIYGNADLTVTDCTFNTYKDYSLKYVATEGNVATFEGNKVYNSKYLVQLGSAPYAGSKYTVKINNTTLGDGVSHYYIDNDEDQMVYIDGVCSVSTSKQLTYVVSQGVTNIKLADGEYDVTGCGGKNLTISGSKKAVLKLTNEGEDGCDYGFGSGGTGVGTYIFNGITIDTQSNTGNYKGYAYMGATFNDCSFVGAYSLNNANDFVFNNCTFDFKNGYFWTWGANSATFEGCIFNGNSKTILAHGYASTKINIKDCQFNATGKGYTGAGDNTAVVEIDPAGTNTYTIVFTGNNTKTEHYNGWTRIKDGSTGHSISGIE